MKKWSKILGSLLVCCMVMSALAVTAFATEQTNDTVITLPEEIWEMPEILTTGYEFSIFALGSDGNPTLKSTNEVKWIDRLADLPDYATDFYDWLLENSDGDGIDDGLIDPVAYGEENNGNYVHTVCSLKNVPLSFTYPAGASKNEITAAAAEAVSEAIRENQSEISAYILAVYSAFDRDHPEVFWLSGSSMSGSSASYSYRTNGDGTGSITYTLSMMFYLQTTTGFDVRDASYRNVSDIMSAISSRDSAVNSILAGATGSRKAKIQHLNNWLTKNNSYNSSANLNNIHHDCRECVSALKGSSGTNGPVCEGYARAFKVLCDELNIPCVLVNGYADSGEAHMWNNVQMDDGKWYAVDVTWDDPLVRGVTGAVSGYENEKYLLVGSKTAIDGMMFGASHLVTNTVTGGGVAFTNGPQLEQGSYQGSSVAEYEVSGTVTSYLDETADVTIELVDSNGTVAYTTSVTGNSASYKIFNVTAGSYTMNVRKANHVARSYPVDVENTDLKQDITIRLRGDVNMDGKVNIADCSRLLAHMKKLSKITEPYTLLCADVTGEGIVNIADCSRLLAHLKRVAPMW